LNVLTKSVFFPPWTAHATTSAENCAQDGLPTPVAFPVDMKFHAAWAGSQAVDKNNNGANTRWAWDLANIEIFS
jgi:hypothetical protein